MAQAKVLTKDEIKRVLRMSETTKYGLRDRTAFSLSFYGGMRVGEIAALSIGDIRGIDGNAVDVIHLAKHQTKGDKSRRVFVGDDLKRELNCYLKTLTKLSNETAFIRSSRTGGYFSTITLSTLMKRIYLACGIATSSHSGRRTFATRKNELGVGMRTIQKLLGHANISSTALYCDVSDEQLKNAVNQV